MAFMPQDRTKLIQLEQLAKELLGLIEAQQYFERIESLLIEIRDRLTVSGPTQEQVDKLAKDIKVQSGTLQTKVDEHQ